MTNTLTTLRRRPVGSLFDEMFDELMTPFFANERRGANTPAMNVVETADGYRIAYELPGVKMDDVSVQVEEGQLVVSAERKLEKSESDGEKFHRVEHRYGRFARSVTLPKDVHTEDVQAVFKDGVLTVTLRKQEPSQARRIEVRAE